MGKPTLVSKYLIKYDKIDNKFIPLLTTFGLNCFYGEIMQCKKSNNSNKQCKKSNNSNKLCKKV